MVMSFHLVHELTKLACCGQKTTTSDKRKDITSISLLIYASVPVATGWLLSISVINLSMCREPFHISTLDHLRYIAFQSSVRQI